MSRVGIFYLEYDNTEQDGDYHMGFVFMGRNGLISSIRLGDYVLLVVWPLFRYRL